MHDNPRFKQIPLHTFRNYFATEKLRDTKMLTHVQYLIGHISIVNIERHIHLVNYDGEKFISSVAQTVEEVSRLQKTAGPIFKR